MDEKRIEELIEQLQSDDGKVFRNAAGALAEIGEPAVPFLISALKDEDADVRKNAAYVLADAAFEGQDITPAVPALVKALSDEDYRVRMNAAEALGDAAFKGQDITPAVPTLVKALSDEDWEVRETTAETLRYAAEEFAIGGDYSSALKIIKDSTAAIMGFYSGKKNLDSLEKRRHILKPFADVSEKIHNIMNPDKKKFPVKHQPVRALRKKVISNG